MRPGGDKAIPVPAQTFNVIANRKMYERGNLIWRQQARGAKTALVTYVVEVAEQEDLKEAGGGANNVTFRRTRLRRGGQPSVSGRLARRLRLTSLPLSGFWRVAFGPLLSGNPSFRTDW